MENVREKLCYGVPLSKLQVFLLQPLALPSMLVKLWKIPEITCTVEFTFCRSRRYQVPYPRSFNNVRFAEEDWFYKGESDFEVIVIAAGSLEEGAPPAGWFSHYDGSSFPSNLFLSP